MVEKRVSGALVWASWWFGEKAGVGEVGGYAA
jgi:hypothetical protein